MARPEKYTVEIFDKINSEISEGRSLRSILKQDGMPSSETFYRWLREVEGLSTQYARAKEDRADSYADEIVDIADTELDPQKARVMIDARKWIASKLHPRNYGEKMALEHSGRNGGAIEVKTIFIEKQETKELMDHITKTIDAD